MTPTHPTLLAYLSLALLCVSGIHLHGNNYFELDLGDLETAQAEFPAWLDEVTETGGQFVGGEGWQIGASRPFGSGRLFLTIAPAALTGDLALTFISPNAANIAVQLYDVNERILALDLLAYRQNANEASAITTLVVPISDFPTARHIVLRRLDGPVQIHYLSLVSLTAPVNQQDARLAQLAALLGDPMADENPLIASLQPEVSNKDETRVLLDQAATASQPLIELATRDQTKPLSLNELLSVLQILGLQGYDFNATDFVRAAGEGREEIVRLYLRAGMPIDAPGKHRYTAAAEAASSGELRVLRLLCERGADLEIKTVGGNSALRMACLNAHTEAVRLLVESGAELDSIGAYGYTLVKSLFQNRTRNYDLIDATVIYLLEKGANPDIPDNNGRTLIHDIAQFGRVSMMRQVVLYSKHLNVEDNDGMTPIMYANYRNSASMERVLIEAGVPAWEPAFETAEMELVYSVYRRNYSRTKELLKAGTDPNTLDFRGESLIFKVVNQRNLRMAELLVENGINLHVRDNKGQSPLGRINGSYHSSRETMMDYLLERGIDPNDATPEDLKQKKPYWTPLMKAADSGNSFRCRRLLEAGADPTVKNRPNRTAAIIAERAGHLQLAEELKAAEIQWRTKHGSG